MQLRTERLLLREFTPADADALAAYQRRPEYRRYYDEVPDAAELVARFVRWQHEEPRVRYQLAITLDGRVIGCCGIREAEFGLELDPDYWGQGYALEAGRAILAFGRDTLGHRRIRATTNPDHTAAIRLAERLGLRPGDAPGEFVL